MNDENIKIFKALADKSRLMIINNLLEGPMYVELLAERLGISPSTVSFHLKKLEEVKLVRSKKEQYYVVYSLNKEILSVPLSDLIKIVDTEENIQKERENKYKTSVIEAFFQYGKLISIPVQRKKRKIVLDEIAKKFEKGRQYSEKEVNIIIADFNDDFCTIRREMVAFKILDRKDNIYWKL